MNDAPARISMIIAVRRVEPITLAQNDGQVSEPDHQAMAREPSTPQAAHSVAVAQPNRSVAKTRTMRRRQGMRFADSRSFSPSVIRGSGGGCRDGLARCQTAM